ncbi:uncharacterized protein LOC126728593 [Quercus robur]|uniref:uncharacterized protein LOC126728593 n=1 Tax=Quercus robur TaxID=38942 RepID=UPI002163C69E|nr:uncharacterized protein LOC126728593 [Quercus robur]
MKQKCPTYLKCIGKSKALTDTLSNTKLEDDSDNEDDGILNTFIATVNPTEGIVKDGDDEEDLVDSKFEKMDDQDDIHTAYEKLYKVLLCGFVESPSPSLNAPEDEDDDSDFDDDDDDENEDASSSGNDEMTA